MPESPLSAALRSFETTEANLNKLERLWGKACALIPDSLSFGDDPGYEDTCRSIELVAKYLPSIDGWRPNFNMIDLNTIAQTRRDYLELEEQEARISL